MIEGIIVILVAGFAAGVLAERLTLPRLVGMLFAGILIGPYVLNLIPLGVLAVSREIRLLALVVILFKAGLGLDKSKLRKNGTVALRLGFVPCTLEASIVALVAHYLLGWGWLSSWVLGWVICSESPAVLVPMMLRLKSEGWGVKKGIPDLVLAGGALSDVVAITVFGIVLGLAANPSGTTAAGAIGAMVVQIVGGLLFGYMVGRLTTTALTKMRVTESPVQDLLVALVIAAGLVLLGDAFGFSGYLAVMTFGFTMLDHNEVLARRLRAELDRVWIVAEVFLFVLIGAAVNIGVLSGIGLAGVVVIALGLLLGRTPGILLSTWGSTLVAREKLFMSVSYIAKATVQAAIGALPLAAGIAHGEEILAFAVLSIMLTAPIGAWGSAALAPAMLEKGEVDPSKVTVKDSFRFLVALDAKQGAVKALQQAARVARQVDAKLIILHVDQLRQGLSQDPALLGPDSPVITDIEHEVVVSGGNVAETIIEKAEAHRASFIFMGKSNQSALSNLIVGDVTRQVVENSRIPVIVVE